uniref:ARAD1D15312p n=1 Tax=Blastobotrys adeninivorans TaxID=409370 RepID=A0A060TEI2_BLAAD
MGNAASKRALPKAGTAAKAVENVKKTGGVNIGRQAPPKPEDLQSPKGGEPRANGEKNDDIHYENVDPIDPIAEKLKSLGTVKYKPIEMPYKKTNDLLTAIEARQRLQEEQKLAKDDPEAASRPKKAVHPSTLASILQSIKEGDSNERIMEDYNLDASLLQKLGPRFKLPERPIPKPANREPEEAREEDVPGRVTDSNVETLHEADHRPNSEYSQVRPPKKFKSKVIEI